MLQDIKVKKIPSKVAKKVTQTSVKVAKMSKNGHTGHTVTSAYELAQSHNDKVLDAVN